MKTTKTPSTAVEMPATANLDDSRPLSRDDRRAALRFVRRCGFRVVERRYLTSQEAGYTIQRSPTVQHHIAVLPGARVIHRCTVPV